MNRVSTLLDEDMDSIQRLKEACDNCRLGTWNITYMYIHDVLGMMYMNVGMLQVQIQCSQLLPKAVQFCL